MSAEINPYSSSDSQEPIRLSLSQKLAVLGVGVVVTLASAASMLAICFGVLMAVAGRLQPPPVSLNQLLLTQAGKWIAYGAVTIIPVSLFLGSHAALKVMRMQFAVQEALMKRRDLRQQVESLRRAVTTTAVLPANPEIPTPSVSRGIHGDLPIASQ